MNLLTSPRSLDRPRVEWVALAFALAVEMSLLILAAQHGHNDYFPPPSTTIRPWAKWMPSLVILSVALPSFGGARGRRRSGNQSETEEPTFLGGFARRGRPCCYP